MKENSSIPGTKTKYLFPLVVTLLYFLYNLYLTLHHEPWRDEAQAWLISRDLSIMDIIRQMKYEGHPSLWHFILALFSKSGFPYITLNYISLAIMTISAFLVLYHMPVNKISRIVALMGAGFVYYYSVVSRSYCLIVLFTVLSAISYPHRSRYPVRYGICLALLTYTHVLALGFAASLTGLFILEELFFKFKNINNKERLHTALGMILPVASIFLLCAQLFGSIGNNSNVSRIYSGSKFDLNEIYTSSLDYLKFIFSSYAGLEFTSQIFTSLMIILSILSVIFTVYFLRQSLILLFGIGWHLLVNYFIYPCTMIQKQLVLYFIVFFCLWTILYDKPFRVKYLGIFNNHRVQAACSAMLIIVSCLSFANLSRAVKEDIELPYSNSKAVAEYINSELPGGSTIIATSDIYASPVAPYLKNHRLWNPITQRYFSFITWSKERTGLITWQELEKRIIDNFHSDKNVYLLDSGLPNVSNTDKYLEKLQLLKIFDNEAITDEMYYALYHIDFTR